MYAKAKQYIGAGSIVLGSGIFKMQLHRTSASATILVLSTRSVSTSIAAQISATGGWTTGGQTIPATKWTVGASAKVYKFTYTTAGLIITASNSSLNNIRYALVRNSTSATGGKVLCFVTLSTAAFTINSGSTLTIGPNATGGVFALS